MVQKKGFTLLEILVTITIIGILAAVISGNFVNSLKKGRDAKRKADLGQIRAALELYYEDNKAYPLSVTFGGQITHPTIGSKYYMTTVPIDPSGFDYAYDSDGTYYKLYSCIENDNDQGSGVDQGGYAESCGAGCPACKFGISSPNTTL